VALTQLPLVQTSNLGPANLKLKNATSCLPAQSPRVDHNRDRAPD